MKVATILPTNYLDIIEDRPYHMALAHLVGKDQEYTEFYRQQAEKGNYVILDNGVIETGKPMNIMQLVTCAKKIAADEIILPDVFQDDEATLNNACEAIPIARHELPGVKLMAVPQGKTLEEWVDCARMLLEMDIDVLGIPKVLTKMAGRDGRLMALLELGNLLRGIEVHLLGCWENPIECTVIEKASQAGRIRPVRGVDSGIAYVYAREGMLITDGPRPSGDIHFDAKDADREKLIRNIEIWEAACELDESKIKRLFV